MKITDDYRAKMRLWAAHPTVAASPPPPKLPDFAPRKFSNHLEMNRWKRDLLLRTARETTTDG